MHPPFLSTSLWPIRTASIAILTNPALTPLCNVATLVYSQSRDSPSGRLYHDKWKVSSFVNHSSLLTTTILCLDLDRDIARQASIQFPDSTGEEIRRETITQALHNSYKIWLQSSRLSQGAREAAEVLKILLG